MNKKCKTASFILVTHTENEIDRGRCKFGRERERE